MMGEMIDTEKLLLDSVNILLETTNMLPIEDEADFEVVVEARQAKKTLIEVKRAVLSEQWDINTDENYILPLSQDGMIPVPANVMDITGDNGDVINRNWRLYSKQNQSHVFDSEVPCTIVWDMMFNSLPAPIRHYITIRAARIFTARTIGDDASYKYTAADEETARLAARRSESRTGQYNMLTGTYGQNNRIWN